MAATTTTTTDTDLNTPLGRESVLSEYFDAPILAIRTSQAMADKDVAILQPTSTTALAAEAPPRTSMDSTNGASGVGRVRSLLRKKRPAEAQAATAAAAAGVGAGAATAPAGKTTPPTAATAPAPGPTPAPAPAKPVSTLTSVTAPPPLTAPSKPSSIAPGPVSAVPSTENEVSPAGAAPADGVLSRDYIARAPSRASKRSSKLAPTAAATAVAAATTSPFVRTSSRASKRSTTRASSRASKSSKKSARAPSRASTAGGTSIYDTASDSSALAARDARASSSSDEDDSGRDGPASFYSPVSRARSARHSRHASLPPARREPEGRASVVGSVRRERAKSISGRSSRTARQSVIGMGGGTFGRGAGTIGPGAVPESEESREFRERGELAVGGLSQKQVKRIGKEELKEGKRLAKVLKHEGKVERKALEVAMKELAELQAMQKQAIKEESRAHTAHAKTLKATHAAELVFLDAQRRLQVAQAELRAKETGLDASREHAATVTERVQEKNREVELLRAQKGADSREREAKVRKLTGKV